MASSDISLGDMMNEALAKNKTMNAPPPPPEVQAIQEPKGAAEFIYPTLIIIPLVITAVIVLTLKISVVMKIFLLLLIAFVMTCYILQLKKYDVAELFNKVNPGEKKN